MARGIQLPTKAVNGRWQMLSGDAYIEQLIRVALLGSESDNPFQDIGLGSDIIFDINDGLLDGEIRSKLEQVFSIFERDQLARLAAYNLEHVDGDVILVLSYINLETGARIEDVQIPLGSN